MLYRHSAARYALFWPFVSLGHNYVRAAAFGGVGAGAVAKVAMPMFAVRVDERENMRLPARTHRDALACVAHLAARGATRIELYQGARMRADGRTLWAATDTFSREPSLEILAPTGLVIKAKLDPLRAGDFRHITSLAAGDLASTDREVGLPAVTRFVDRVSNVDPEKGMGAFDDKLKAAAAKLRADQGKLDRAWVKTADKHFTKITEDTRASVKNRFMGGLAVDLSQPQVAAVERFVEQQGWFVRGMDGQRNTALTERARKIVANGLAQGFGRAQIADDMRKQLPDMWQGMGKSYAHVVAANGLARARAHSELSSYQDGGIQYAEVVAMLDERTSDICRLMDGQIIPIKGALGLANQAASVTTPEDVGQVTPFLRERRNDKGALEIRAGSKVLGSFDREGSGRVDDRGRAQQYTAGAGFIDAKVGAPPYHHNCRTTLLPRMDIAQVPKGQAVRATGPAPAGAGDVLSFGALEQFKMPTARAPVTTGTLAPIDDYGIPAWKAPPKAIQAAVTSDQQALGLRVMGAQAATRGFDTSAPWARVSQQEAATARATLATANDAMVQVLHTGSPRQVAGAMLANPASIGREQIIQLRDAKGREVWARFTGRSSKALNEAADAVRLATTPAEAALASENLFNAAVREGTVRIGDSLEAVSAPKGSRVTTGTSGFPARNPRNGGGARATAEQPQRGTKRGVGASPITEEPATPYKGDLRKTYAGAGATVFSARPDGAVIARETWAHGRGVWSSAAVDINGNALNRSAWESLSATHGNTTQAALSVVRPRPSDRVVNVVGTRVVDLALTQTRRYIVSALEAEREIKHGVDRDWIISDHDGGALFLRVDGSKLASLRKDVFAKAANAWVRSGSDTDLRKLGGTLEDTLGRFYLSARVDWQQRNLIVGVPLAEQVDRRVATVRDEIQMAIRSQEATKGRGMTAAEKGAIVQRMVRDGSAMAKPSAVLPDRTERMGPDELRGAMALDQERAGIKGTVALQRGAIYRRAVDFAFAPCSDALLQAVSAMGSPRIYYAPGAPRTLAIAHDTLLGEGGSGVVVVVPRDVDKLLRGSTPAAREDRSALRHAAAHLYGLAGQTDVAARIARNRGARDISSVRAGDLDVFGKGGGLAAMALPGAWVSPYDARVYGQDAARIRKLIGKPFEARMINDPEDVNAWATRTGQEFLSTAVERLEDAVAIGTNWEIAPDQVAFMISALRGHYVPH